MDADTSTARIRRATPVSSGNPPHGGFSCGFRWEQAYTFLRQREERGGRDGQEHTVKYVSDVVSFFGVWGVFRPPLRATCKVLVRDGGLCVSFEAVYPRISDPIGKLFFLTPEDRFREVRLYLDP